MDSVIACSMCRGTDIVKSLKDYKSLPQFESCLRYVCKYCLVQCDNEIHDVCEECTNNCLTKGKDGCLKPPSPNRWEREMAAQERNRKRNQ